MNSPVPVSELDARMKNFRKRMDLKNPNWDLTAIFGNINLYYFTGTMQDGMLLIPRNEEAVYWVRRSYERALDESQFSYIRQMNSYREAAAEIATMPESVYLEKDILPLAYLERFLKYFPISTILPADQDIAMVRAVKSPYELVRMKESGKIHQKVLEEQVPDLLVEGMNEVDLAMALYHALIDEGHHGVARFGMFNTEMLLGQIGFGESSLYPTRFDGPGGSLGMSPAVPLLGNRSRRLKKGDLIFIDVGCGVGGYHTDKTMTYMFKSPLSESAIEAHITCVDVQNNLAKLLVPGNTPSSAYNTIMQDLDEDFLKGFMGYKERTVKFLGHGVGLLIDEIPVIAKGFEEPLVENMVFALEPKKGVENVGMVGIENTFLVTKDGGKSITGSHPGLMPLY